jgi:hypothetical protein
MARSHGNANHGRYRDLRAGHLARCRVEYRTDLVGRAARVYQNRYVGRNLYHARTTNEASIVRCALTFLENANLTPRIASQNGTDCEEWQRYSNFAIKNVPIRHSKSHRGT